MENLLPQNILQLTIAERIQLVQDIWDTSISLFRLFLTSEKSGGIKEVNSPAFGAYKNGNLTKSSQSSPIRRENAIYS